MHIIKFEYWNNRVSATLGRLHKTCVRIRFTHSYARTHKPIHTRTSSYLLIGRVPLPHTYKSIHWLEERNIRTTLFTERVRTHSHARIQTESVNTHSDTDTHTQQQLLLVGASKQRTKHNGRGEKSWEPNKRSVVAKLIDGIEKYNMPMRVGRSSSRPTGLVLTLLPSRSATMTSTLFIVLLTSLSTTP